MFLKKDTITVRGESVVLHELSALQRVEYFEFLSVQEARMGQESTSPAQMAQTMRINVEVNAWLVSRSLWHAMPERTEEEVFRDVLRTWPSAALNEAVDKVLVLSDMVPATDDKTDTADHKEEADATLAK